MDIRRFLPIYKISSHKQGLEVICINEIKAIGEGHSGQSLGHWPKIESLRYHKYTHFLKALVMGDL